ncbi:cytochrome oxidase subunit III [Pedobacter quisquiliarum]|jgi:cytochrome c oxidase subunit 3|uniref:Cytochrome oxidase subunit III n=1 Tax=Pedobacter quisquiliarum TaxID=1834438 RepID=A0A916UHW8_9SPHI|nr:cytochrome c oxidase subunit 3 [Pedobacter quisquiliarum]GGC72870.1 cytochrome oxidase subunit III [Pedobacter quisquiliarum]
MVQSINHQEANANYKAKKFIIWLFVVSSTIMFAGWTSYYIVFAASKSKGHGLVLPDMFLYSTGVLLVSSICLFLAARAFRNGELAKQKTFLWATLLLGVVFGYLQVEAWVSLYQSGAFLVNNNAAISIIYIVSGIHLLHILAGLLLILSTLLGAYGKIATERLQFRMEVSSIFWHFIDILWIYLYVFLLLNS